MQERIERHFVQQIVAVSFTYGFLCKKVKEEGLKNGKRKNESYLLSADGKLVAR